MNEEVNKWARNILNIGHFATVIMILVHVLWLIFARDFLITSVDLYIQNYIILPATGFLVINLMIEALFRADFISPKKKEFLAIVYVTLIVVHFQLKTN